MFDKKMTTKKRSSVDITITPSASTAATRLTMSTKGGASEIRFKDMCFIITDRPTEATLDSYIAVLEDYNVKDVVRVCAPTYDAARLQKHGINVNDWMFPDGQPPPADVLNNWLTLVKRSKTSNGRIAIHCVAGLGRAPVLVAVALIELGMKYDSAVALIRTKRRGAINQSQLLFLKHYRPHNRLGSLKPAHKETVCSIQ